MDTRQLAAFCAVVERKSFSQAAERLGVTQPAVSLQVRALEKRLGTQLLDRSGRRVEPTEAGLRLYRGAQRMLALEDRIARRSPPPARARSRATWRRRVDRAGGDRRPDPALRVPAREPGVSVFLAVSDTHAIVERVAARDLELGIVGAARRRTVASASSPSSPTRSSSPARLAIASPGATVTLDELREETLILMQEGAGVRQIVEDGLRRQGVRLRDLDVRLELGLQESVRAAVEAGYGVTFISRTAVEADLAGGDARGGAGRGPRRHEGDLARLGDGARRSRAPTRSSTSRASGSTRDRPLGARGARSPPRGAGVSASPCSSPAARVRARRPSGRARFDGVRRHSPLETVASATRAAAGADGLVGLGGGSAIDTAKAVVGHDVAPARRGADDVRRRRSGRRTSACATRPDARKTGGSGRTHGRHRLRAAPHARAPHGGDGRHGDERARARRRGAVPGPSEDALEGARLIGEHLPAAASDGGDLEARTGCSRGDACRPSACRARPLPRARHGAGARRTLRPLPRRHERDLPPAGAALQRAAVPQALAALASALAADDAPARVEELARLGGIRRLRDLGVPEDDSQSVAADPLPGGALGRIPEPPRVDDIEVLLRSIW